jgi:hypothetical protein
MTTFNEAYHKIKVLVKQFKRECEWLDDEKDKLVYELYGLSEEEIKIIEEE